MPSGVKDIQLLELKDTISQLNKTISTQNELISSLQKMLEERNAKDSEKDLLIANLQSQLAYLKNKVFGSTSEIRHDQLDGQLNLFGTPVGDEKPAEVIEPEVISVKGYTKERKPKATYDDKYNSVRSICKHFFTDIVGLSIKFFCVSLRHMSIGRVGLVRMETHLAHLGVGLNIAYDLGNGAVLVFRHAGLHNVGQDLFVGQHVLENGVLAGAPVHPGNAACNLRFHGRHLPLGSCDSFLLGEGQELQILGLVCCRNFHGGHHLLRRPAGGFHQAANVLQPLPVCAPLDALCDALLHALFHALLHAPLDALRHAFLHAFFKNTLAQITHFRHRPFHGMCVSKLVLVF